jgi:hypothetical protein
MKAFSKKVVSCSVFCSLLFFTCFVLSLIFASLSYSVFLSQEHPFIFCLSLIFIFAISPFLPIFFKNLPVAHLREICAASQDLTEARYVTFNLSPRLVVVPATSCEV